MKINKEIMETEYPRIIWNHLVDYKDKWLLTVSTLKGCTHSCKFCDVANLPKQGNLTNDEIINQIKLLLRNTDYVKETK